MEILKSIVLIIHFIGWAMVIGGWLAHIKSPLVAPGMAHGAATALVTGILLVGLTYAVGEGDEINNIKITIKAIIALTVTVLAFLEMKKPAPNPRAHLVGGLAVVNVAVAVLW